MADDRQRGWRNRDGYLEPHLHRCSQSGPAPHMFSTRSRTLMFSIRSRTLTLPPLLKQAQLLKEPSRVCIKKVPTIHPGRNGTREAWKGACMFWVHLLSSSLLIRALFGRVSLRSHDMRSIKTLPPFLGQNYMYNNLIAGAIGDVTRALCPPDPSIDFPGQTPPCAARIGHEGGTR